MAEGDEAFITQSSKTEKKKVTLEDFITKHPLYTSCEIEPVSQLYLPASLSYHCPGPDPCGKETTWLKVEKTTNYVQADPAVGFHVVCYLCARCNKRELWVMYREMWSELEIPRKPRPITALGSMQGPDPGPRTVSVVSGLLKIGQTPPLSIALPRALEDNLGKEASAFYKKALINRNEGNGLAAVTYIRRVVEDKTDELIEIVAQTAEAQEVDPKGVELIRAVKTDKNTYDLKLQLASTVLPRSMTPGGANALGALYNLVSQGIHDLSERDCVDVADTTQSVFEYVFTNLRAETKKRKDFVSKVTKLVGRKT